MPSRDPLPTRALADERSGATEKATSVELPRALRMSSTELKVGSHGEDGAEERTQALDLDQLVNDDDVPERTQALDLDQLVDDDDEAPTLALPLEALAEELPASTREPTPAPVTRPALDAEPARQRELSGTFQQMVGATLGSFKLIQPLAAGGMGAVFLARKEGPSGVRQHAALKLIHAQLAGEPDFIDMFLDEARIASFVQHPNVCRVLDFGVDRGTYYLAMEYVHGETWAELSARLSALAEAGQVLPALTAFVLAQACEGLHAAHIATGDDGEPLQIVHRDVSPQNLFVAYDGTVRVIDFGVARARDRITSTRAGVVKGKIAYMSPEQIAGGSVDHRSDVWALGVLLRESLEGRRLFRRNNDTETVRALMVEPIPPWNTPVDPQLRAIADTALERDVSRRFQSAREMGAALTSYLRKLSTPVGTPELSHWMDLLFPSELEEKRALLRSDGVPSQPDLPERADVAVTRRPRKKRKASVPALLQGKLQRRHVGGLALALLGGGLLVALARRPDDSTAQASAVMAYEGAEELAPRPMSAPTPLSLGPRATQRAAPPASAPSPPPSEDTRAARLAAQGSLLVAYRSGWAEVYLRGKKLGTTPGLFRLPAGTHTLLIKPQGKDPGFSQRVTVPAGETHKLLLP